MISNAEFSEKSLAVREQAPPLIPYLGLSFQIQMVSSTEEVLSGFAWRSLIGLVAKQYFPEIFRVLFEGESQESRLWAFAFIPKQLEGLVEFRINLLGTAAAWGIEFYKILEICGTTGVGRHRQKFRVVEGWFKSSHNDVVQFLRGGALLAWPVGRLIGLQPLALGVDSLADSSPLLLAIDWQTPVLLKANGRYLQQAPSFRLLVDRMATRINHVCQAVNGCDLLVDPDRSALQALADKCRLLDASTQAVPLSRKSARTQQTMKVEALTGRLVYLGNLAAIAPLLDLASRLQLGSKTGLGFGAFEYSFIPLTG